jgi:hypothetical protein
VTAYAVIVIQKIGEIANDDFLKLDQLVVILGRGWREVVIQVDILPSDIEPGKSILSAIFGDLGLINGEWRIIGSIRNWPSEKRHGRLFADLSRRL